MSGHSHRPPDLADLPPAPPMGVQRSLSNLSQVQAQMQQQIHVLDNLKYEGEILTDKLMKLRSNRQDLEAELFGLKHKRIQLLEVIRHLEDEEMQLVSEVHSIRHHKRQVLAELPCFGARARAAAGLAVVQDYLLASCHHLAAQQQQQQAAGDAAAAAAGGDAPGVAAAAAAAAAVGMVAVAAAPLWSGTAQVPRPSATWDMTLLPARAATATASTQTGHDVAAGGEQPATQPHPAADREQPQLQPPPSQPRPKPCQVQAPGQQRAAHSPVRGPFGDMTPGQLLQLQRRESMTPSDSLPTLHEGKPLAGRAGGGLVLGGPRVGGGPSDSARSSMEYARSSGEYPRSSGEFYRSGSGSGMGSARSSVRDGSSLYTLSSISSVGGPGRQGSTSAFSRGTSVSLGTSPSGSSFTSAHRPLSLSSRPSLEEAADSAGAGARRQRSSSSSQQQGAGRGGSGLSPPPPPPPPPPPHRARSGSLPLAGSLVQELHMQRLSQQQQLQQQQQQQHEELQQLVLAHQHMQRHEQHAALLQQIQQQRLLDAGASPVEAAAAAGAVLGYDTSAASLDVVSIASSSLPGYSTGSLPPHMPGAGSSEALWGLPPGTLVLQGEGAGGDMSQRLASLVQLSGVDSAQLQSLEAGVPGAAAQVAADVRRLTLDEAFQLAVAGGGGADARGAAAPTAKATSNMAAAARSVAGSGSGGS